MSNSTTIKVFISCPNDLDTEKKALIQFLRDYSQTTEEKYQIRLQELTYEKDADRGDGRPQEKANRLIDICDIYLGMMAKRFGGSTGLFASGTHEEFVYARHRKEREGKPAIRFFFKKVAIDMDASEQEFEQAKKIRQFKNEIQGHFFWDNFTTKTDLIEKVKKELEKILKEWKPEIKREKIEPAEISEKEMLSNYINFLKREYSEIRIFQDKSFLLKDIYVSL
ncbi:MAG: DUF4062 domain-containing protein, partial [bacterium]|nr:DUF4062 domain-containing protein [bacterium]